MPRKPEEMTHALAEVGRSIRSAVVTKACRKKAGRSFHYIHDIVKIYAVVK